MKRFTAFLYLIVFCSQARGQSVYTTNDAALWFNLYIEKKMGDHFTVHLNQQDRLNNNFTRYGLGYADVGITWKPIKQVKILADYVFVEKQKLNFTYSARHQFYVALMLKKDFRRLGFTYRNMLQNQYVDFFSSEGGHNPQFYERNKYTLKYEHNKYFTSYIAQEIYLPLNDPRIKGFDRIRSFIGGFYNVTRHQQLELYFLFQHQLQSKNALNNDFVYGIGYSIYL